MELEDIPKIETGEHVRADIEFDTGAAIQSRLFYLTEKSNHNPESSTITVYRWHNPSGIYGGPEELRLSDIIKFEEVVPKTVAELV